VRQEINIEILKLLLFIKLLMGKARVSYFTSRVLFLEPTDRPTDSGKKEEDVDWCNKIIKAK
jgi:hypothetical protein